MNSHAPSEARSIELQRGFAKSSNVFDRRDLARNPYLLLEIQFILANDSDPMVRRELAGCSNLSLELENKLMLDNDGWVKSYLIENKYLNPETFCFLCMNSKELVYKILSNIQNRKHVHNKKFRYNNPKTQELFEKYLLLV